MSGFWERVTSGLEMEALWRQFVNEAREGYGLYSQEVDWDAANDKKSKFKWAVHVFKAFFWSLILKLSPPRRILLLIGLILLLGILSPNPVYAQLGGVVFFILLALELADRVVMKRDLQIAREIQGWLVPSQPPIVAGAELAFASRPANTVSGDYYDAFWRGEPPPETASPDATILSTDSDQMALPLPPPSSSAQFSCYLECHQPDQADGDRRHHGLHKPGDQLSDLWVLPAREVHGRGGGVAGRPVGARTVDPAMSQREAHPELVVARLIDPQGVLAGVEHVRDAHRQRQHQQQRGEDPEPRSWRRPTPSAQPTALWREQRSLHRAFACSDIAEMLALASERERVRHPGLAAGSAESEREHVHRVDARERRAPSAG